VAAADKEEVIVVCSVRRMLGKWFAKVRFAPTMANKPKPYAATFQRSTCSDILDVEGSFALISDLDRTDTLSLSRDDVTIRYLNSSVKAISAVLGNRVDMKS
jgi:hypothetical protein